MPKIPQPYELAKQFCHVLANWLTPEQLADVVRQNAAEADPNICHTHDHCDANMAMRTAACLWSDPLESVPPEADEGPMSADWLACWNDAWRLAKAADFRPECIRPEMDGLKRYEAIIRSPYPAAAPTIYADWFTDDAAAQAGYRQIMEAQGYTVQTVEIGFPCIVTIR
jgi:hypothetical protein